MVKNRPVEVDAFIRVYTVPGDAPKFTWQGGAIARISKEALEDINPEYIQQSGNVITLGTLQVCIIDFDLQSDCYLVGRVSNADSLV